MSREDVDYSGSVRAGLGDFGFTKSAILHCLLSFRKYFNISLHGTKLSRLQLSKQQ
jgi:hypothetical protein